MNIFLRPALEPVKRLLSEAGLPTADLTPRHLEHFLAQGSDQRLTGTVGLEIDGDVALLRSLAVAADCRGRGYGQELVAAAERHARSQGVNELYLLTTTAQRFFERLGYRASARATAPAAISATQEFASMCPASAAFMVKELVPGIAAEPG